MTKQKVMKMVAHAALLALLAATLAAFLTACDGATPDSYVPNRPISVTLPPYGDSQNSADAQCQHRMQDVVTLEEGLVISACTRCGYSDSGYRYYHARTDSNTLVRDEKIIIRLSAEYRETTLNVRSDVTEVILVGSEGQTLDGLRINVGKRNTPFTVGLYNVNVVASESIIASTECAEPVTVKSYGTSCSLTTRTAASGGDGELEYVDFHTAQFANPGGDGRDAAHVIDVAGEVEVYAFCSLALTGGNGGQGGNGASHKKGPQYVAKNNGGNGGNGGDGGDAIHAGGTVTVYNSDFVTLTGGRGGNGGSGGAGGGGIYGSKDGQPGSRGNDGKTVCEFFACGNTEN